MVYSRDMNVMDTGQLRALVYLEDRGITEETAEAYGLHWDVPREAIAIPYRSALGELVTTRYRLVGSVPGHGTNQKYDSTRDSTMHLYNVVDAVKSPVYLAEGEFDTLVLKQLGLNAVGVPGATAFDEAWRWLFAGCEVRIIFDHDPERMIPMGKGREKRVQPGPDAARKVARALRSVATDVLDLTRELPEGMDVTDAFLEGQLEGVLE